MAPKRRNHPPTVYLSRTACKMALSALQRRLRQTVGDVEWRDVVAALAADRVLDAVWGGEDAGVLIRILAALLGISAD